LQRFNQPVFSQADRIKAYRKMKKKNVLFPAFVVFSILAIYAVWHYRPQKALTESGPRTAQTRMATLGARHQPLIIRKKIPRRSAAGVRETDLPQPLIILKDMIPRPTSKSVEQKKIIAESAAQKNKVLVLQPDGKLSSPQKETHSVKPDDTSKIIARQTEPVSPEKESHHPYSILLASCRLPQSARKVISDYRKAGFDPYITKVEFKNGDVWLRVFTGHYQTRKEALKVKNEHHLSGVLIKKTPYANLVDTFSSQDEMKGSLKRLKDLSYSPYVLKSPANSFQLVVGAFITREGAEKQKAELKSNGIPNEIIER
jgi:cell division septation protein DedD